MKLFVIVSKYFYAGIVLKNNIVVRTAPILKYMKGWTSDKVINYCNNKKWKIKE